jgi:hypothetical protein
MEFFLFKRKILTFATTIGSANCGFCSSGGLVLLLVVVGGVLLVFGLFRIICIFIRAYFIDEAVRISKC